MALPWILFILSIHCRAQVPTETFECLGIDACKKRAIQCTSETDCVVICNGKTACLDVMVIGMGARDVTVLCTPEDTCKGGTLLCGSGKCELDCMAANGKNICNGVTVHLYNAVSFQCPDQCPPHIAPLIFSSNPTTAIPIINPVIPVPSALRSTATNPPTATSHHPTNHPTQPSIFPTAIPTTTTTTTTTTTIVPTGTPTDIPTSNPTHAPSTLPPTRNPTQTPTAYPTNIPTWRPTVPPSTEPSQTPTNIPSVYPTSLPTHSPTDIPTTQPTDTPSQTSTASILSATQNTVDLDDEDSHRQTPTPIFRYIPQNITRARPLTPMINAEGNANIIQHLGNLHILWYISGAAMLILCCSLCILIAFCLSVQHGIKSVESDLSISHSHSASAADMQALKHAHQKIISDTCCMHDSPFEMEMDINLQYENEDKNSNAESSSSECEAHNIEFEDYEDYDEYDEMREGSEWTPIVRPTSIYQPCATTEDDKKAEEKAMEVKAYTVAISRVPSGNKSHFLSFPSVLSLPAAANPFLIEPVDDDNEQELEYDAHYLTIAKLRGQSLSINPEVDQSICSGSGSGSDAQSKYDDITDFIDHLESETVIKANESETLIPPIFNVPISQVTLDREPSHDHSPTLNSIMSQTTEDSLFDIDS